MMLLPFLIFCNLFSVIYANPILKSSPYELVVGTNVSVCCRIKTGNDLVLFVYEKFMDIDERKIFTRKNSKEVKSYTNDWTATNSNDQFCITKYVNSNERDVDINCLTNDEEGLGRVVDREVLSLKVVHIPVISKFQVVSNQTHATIECAAEGSPNLSLQILTSDNQIIKADNTQNTSLEIREVTDKISSDHQYTCFAQVKFVKDYKTTKSTRSMFEPMLLDHKESINTLVGINQNITIVIKSNPAPTISCTPNLVFNKEFQSEDKYTFSANFESVKKSDLITYTCKVSNPYGSRVFNFSLHLKPTQAKRWSDERGIFDNYYQLTWETTSKAGLQNFTIALYEFNKSDSSYKEIRNETILINPDNEIGSKLASLSLKNYVYRISYHVKELKSNTKYQAMITDCNSYGCKSDPVEFRTNSENNLIPEAILQNPPQPIVIAASSTSNSQTSVHNNILQSSLLFLGFSLYTRL